MTKRAQTPAGDTEIKVEPTTTPVTHYVNVWLRSSGKLELGGRSPTLADALHYGNLSSDPKSRRLCVLKVTTTVEVAQTKTRSEP